MHWFAKALRRLLPVADSNNSQADGRAHESEHSDAEEARQWRVAVNNMTQGMLMFDNTERVVVYNKTYLEMYGLSADTVKPGISLRELIAHRIANGFLKRDPEEYRTEILTALAEQKTVRFLVHNTDGREIAVTNHLLLDGSWVSTHEDVTERIVAERKLAKAQAFLNSVIENVPSSVVVNELPDLKYVLVNRAAEEYFGLPRETVIGKTANEVFDSSSIKIIEAHDREFLQSNKTTIFDENTITFPGRGQRIVTTTRVPIAGDDGTTRYLLTLMTDLTERKRAEARIAHMAHHDSLTDLPNRSAFNEQIAATLERATTGGEPFAVLCIDLDRFKEVNDVFGHHVGDGLLQETARRLQEAAPGEFVARLGGDEFIIISTAGAQPKTAEALADRLIAAFVPTMDIESNILRAGLTIGIAVYPNDGREKTKLIANADAALYRAKKEGRGLARLFDPTMDESLRDKRALTDDLRTALERNEFGIHYQPLSATNGDIVGFEALLRWHHPIRGLVPPATFIPIAEEGGTIIPIGEWVLREACREAASWKNPLSIAVNLSPIQFKHGDLAALVHSILLETGLPPVRLELEITENVLIGDFSRAISILRRLKNLGVKISMDDFGTGYSSLAYLQSFPFDKIKIDQSFVNTLAKSSQSAAIVRAVIGLAHGLHLPVVAEGVETAGQLEFLRNELCNEVQGFFVGKPLPIDAYADVVGGRPKRSADELPRTDVSRNRSTRS